MNYNISTVDETNKQYKIQLWLRQIIFEKRRDVCGPTTASGVAGAWFTLRLRGFCRSHTKTFKTNIQMLHTHREWNEYRQRIERKVKKHQWHRPRVCCGTREGHRHHTHMQDSQQKGRGEQILNIEGRGRADWHLPWCKGIPELARSGGHTAAQGHRKTGQITTQIPTSLSATPPRFCNRSGRLHSSILVTLRFNTVFTN